MTAPSPSAGAARGALWATLDIWTQQGLALLTFLVVGNIVGPAVYGVMAIALTVQMLLAIPLRDSYGEAVIQREALEGPHVQAAFWVLVLLGGLLMVASLLLAPVLGALFGAPDVATAVAVLGLTLPLLAAANLMRNLLRRRLDFRALALRSLVAYGGASALAITLAHEGAGLWSLLAYQVTAQALDVLALALQSRFVPRLALSRRHLRDLTPFATGAMATHGLGTLFNEIDRLILGLLMGPAAVGLYGMGRRLVASLDQTVVSVTNGVALPAFSRLQDARAGLRLAVTESARFASLVAFPAYGGLALVGPRLVDLLLSPAWSATGPLVACFALAGFAAPPVLILTTAMRALGQTRLVVGLTLLAILLRLAAALGAVLLGYGLLGVAAAVSAAPYLLLPLRFYWARRQGALDLLAFCRALLPAGGATAAMALCVLGAERAAVILGAAPVLILAAMIAAGVAGYAVALALIARPALHTLWRLMARG